MADSAHRIALPNRLGIANVTAFKEVLTGCFEQSGPIHVEADAVERIDAAGLQLMFAFVTAAQERGQPVEWKAPSEVVLKTATMLGLAEALGLGG